MMFRKVLLAVAFISLSSVALATSGTPQEQAACSPDVRKFCKKVPPGSDDSAYLACLENNRDALSINCLNVLMDHGCGAATSSGAAPFRRPLEGKSTAG